MTADWPAALRCNDRPNVAERDPIGTGKLDGESEVAPAFLDALANAVGQLKNRLQQLYERAYPGLGDIIRYVIDEEESAARDLCFPFPHLVLPDMVEAHFAQLGLALVNQQDKVVASPIFPETQEHGPRRWVTFINHLYLERFQLISSLERRRILRLEFQSGTL